MVRTKLVALLLGPDGVGMVGLFQSSIAMVSQLTGMGIASSGVRQIAEAQGTGNEEITGKTVRTLRRLCWATGLLGWIVTVCLARPLSEMAFDTADNAGLIAILGATLLLTAVSGGQRALIQGTRQITDLAWMTVISSLASTIVAILIYYRWRESGVVPVLIATALVNLSISWWFARRIPVPQSSTMAWSETLQEGKKLTNLGFAFMWGGMAAALLDLGIRGLIIRESGLDGAGVYQAAWGLSGMFATFILRAMATDFYPRITAVANDHPQLNSMVNEQIEIGNLIALPGLLATLAFSPVLMTVFYSKEFVVGAELLPWFVLGIFLRVLSWPVGFSLLAKGASVWYVLTQTYFSVANYFMAWWLIEHLGLIGVGVAVFLTYFTAVLLNLFVAHRLTDFVWSASTMRLIASSALLIVVGFISSMWLSMMMNSIVGLLLTTVSSVVCARGIALRVGQEHRIVRVLRRVPGMRQVLER